MSCAIRFPAVPERLGLGVGMDLPWGDDIGFERHPQAGDTITAKVKRFLARYGSAFEYLFFAFQPKNRNRLQIGDYLRAYDTLFEAAAAIPKRALHHTILNMGSSENGDQRQVLDFTNQLIERYGFLWVVEDLGIWSLAGKPLPYPLPPLLTDAGLAASISNVRRCQDGLSVPLCVEFPGFTEGATFFLGQLDAYDFFRAIAEETDSPVTIDLGHVLSYQWLRRRTGDRMFEGLERLPLAHCFEMHLSGCQITGGEFRDLHHGVLLDEQLALLEHLLPRCPNLRSITYEDPKYTDDGVLLAKAIPNYERLRQIAAQWRKERQSDNQA